VVRRPSFIITTAIFPLLGLLGMAAFLVLGTLNVEQGPTESAVGYVDEAGLITGHHQRGPITFRPFGDRHSGVDALLAGEIDDLYIIPPEYLETGRVFRVATAQPGLQMVGVERSALEEFLLDNLLEGQLPPGYLERVHRPAVVSTMQVDPNDAQPVEAPFDVARFVFFFGMVILVAISVLTTAGFLQQGLSEEKENRIMEVLLSSVSSNTLMLGKLVGLGAVGLLQLSIWLSSALVLLLMLRGLEFDLMALPLPSPMMVIMGVGYFVLAYALIGSLMAALGATTSSYREAQQWSVIFALPPIAPIWFIQALLQDPGSPLVWGLTYFPLTAPTMIMARLAVDAIGPVALVTSTLLIIFSVAAAVMLTLRLFRAYLLMYGQRPSLVNIGRTLVRG
jgi:ABC-2 type transport system permease protein